MQRAAATACVGSIATDARGTRLVDLRAGGVRRRRCCRASWRPPEWCFSTPAAGDGGRSDPVFPRPLPGAAAGRRHPTAERAYAAGDGVARARYRIFSGAVPVLELAGRRKRFLFSGLALRRNTRVEYDRLRASGAGAKWWFLGRAARAKPSPMSICTNRRVVRRGGGRLIDALLLDDMALDGVWRDRAWHLERYAGDTAILAR